MTAESFNFLKGQLLIAGPTLNDNIFQKSVILLADYKDDDGAYGLILNQPVGHTVGHYIKDDEFSPLAQLQVHQGGPVSMGHLTFAAFWQTDHRFHFATRLPVHDAIAHAHRPGTLVRAFIGYSGWQQGQLEKEVKHASWYVLPPDENLLRHQHDRTLWSQLLRPLSPFHKIIAEAPDNPLMN